MEKAKAAVHDFMAKAGHHDTTVHEKVAPAVTHETINRHVHEELQPALDKEVHQDHYHMSVQPVYDREVRPEQHVHRVAPVENREFHHGPDSREIAARIEREAAQFTNKRVEGHITETKATAPVVAGEHIHHHVHEIIQPVIQKETIQPQVVHTTVPVHEVHHNPAQIHTTSALPAISMADYKSQGGVLTGREERYDGFEGEPRTVGTALGPKGGPLHVDAAGAPIHRSRSRSSSRERSTRTGGALGHNTSTTSSHNPIGHHDTTTGKPSLLAKLNPMVDSNGDGKAGFMK